MEEWCLSSHLHTVHSFDLYYSFFSHRLTLLALDVLMEHLDVVAAQEAPSLPPFIFTGLAPIPLAHVEVVSIQAQLIHSLSLDPFAEFAPLLSLTTSSHPPCPLSSLHELAAARAVGSGQGPGSVGHHAGRLLLAGCHSPSAALRRVIAAATAEHVVFPRQQISLFLHKTCFSPYTLSFSPQIIFLNSNS